MSKDNEMILILATYFFHRKAIMFSWRVWEDWGLGKPREDAAWTPSMHSGSVCPFWAAQRRYQEGNGLHCFWRQMWLSVCILPKPTADRGQASSLCQLFLTRSLTINQPALQDGAGEALQCCSSQGHLGYETEGQQVRDLRLMEML